MTKMILGVVLMLTVVSALGWRLLLRGFMRRYYQENYAPIQLTPADADRYPPEHQLRDVPWITTDVPACQSTSLQMIAAQHGIIRPRTHFDFLMAFTYGFSTIPGTQSLFPVSTDPEIGLREAAPYLGLRRRYYITNDPILYVRALRSFLARGYPIRVGLDMGTLYDSSTFIPHSDVLIGYDTTNFYLYETVGLPPASCLPGEHAPGELGIAVPEARLLAAVLKLAQRLSYPWRYSFTIFEPDTQTNELQSVWERLANATLGGNRYGPPTGVPVLERTALQLERQGVRFPAAAITQGLEVAVRFRRDNARYLREQFALNAELIQVANHFETAANCYAAALAALTDGIADPSEARHIATTLREAAAAERAIGKLLLAQAKTQAAQARPSEQRFTQPEREVGP